MKPKLVVGNWKMNKPFDDAQDLILDIQNNLKDRKLQTEVVLCLVETADQSVVSRAPALFSGE